MGLLNKSDKTKILRFIDDISKNIKIRIADVHPWNMTSEQEALCRKLATLASGLEVSVMYEEWTIDTVPALGLRYDKELYVTGGTSRMRCILEHQIVHQDDSYTTYTAIICFNEEMIEDIPIRKFQRMHTDGIKWVVDKVPNIFRDNRISINIAYDVFKFK